MRRFSFIVRAKFDAIPDIPFQDQIKDEGRVAVGTISPTTDYI